MEINRNRYCSLKLLYERTYTLWRDKTRHILDSNHISTQSCELLSLTYKVVVCKYESRVLLALKLIPEAELRILRVYSVANSTVSNTAILLYILDCRFNIINIVQAVKDTHNTQTALDRVATEALDNLVSVRCITEEVTTTRECCKL